MLKNYLRIAFRGLLKNKTLSFINLVGLVLGIASCMLLLLYVQDERNYDAFHEKKESLYRISTFESDGGVERTVANSYYPLANIINTTFPEKTKVVRFFHKNLSVKNLRTNEVNQEKGLAFADSAFFDLFSFSFKLGEPTNALEATNAIVLTESTAEKYFGKENPLGESLILEGNKDFFVSGVIENPPANSTIQFDMLASMRGAISVLGQYYFHPRGAWYYPPVYTFAQIPDKAFVQDWENYQPKWKTANLSERLQDRYTFQLQPIAKMHFQALENDLTAAVQPAFLWILVFIAFLILGIAGINYINLSLTQLIQRFREMGIRKVLGAMNGHILQQMSVEAAVFVGLGLIMGVGLVQFSLPWFNQLTQKQLVLFDIQNGPIWSVLLFTSILLTLMIAIFPHWGLSKYQIVSVLKGKLANQDSPKRSFSIKGSLVVFQFMAAIGLIIATLVIHYQMQFINQKDIGLRPDQVMVIPIRDEAVQNNFKVVKNTLLAQSNVKTVSAISNFPWKSGFYDFSTKFSGNGVNKQVNIPTLLVEEDFLQVMNISIKDGRDFSTHFGSDANSAFLLNESAFQQLDRPTLEGLQVSMSGVKSQGPKEGQVVGITNDFHLKSLHNPIDPLILTIAPESYYLDNIVLQLETENLPATIAALSNSWSKINPNRPFEYFFLDDAFQKLYQKEVRMATIFQSFTIIALIIAFLGLLALSALSAQQRVKEIGIRKVLGASVIGIIRLLSVDFLKLVLFALVIVVPIAWYFMSQWLTNFAYHIELQWWIFALAGGITAIIACLTVGIQAYRAALSNPVKAIKSE